MDNSIMDKIIKAHFEQDEYYIWGIKGLEQWDKCQKLEISGLDISDEIVEVHFSLDQFQGNAERMYGTVKDGVIHADIPVFILEGPEYIYDNTEAYNAYAWVYVSDEESAETIRKMEFEIKARPKPNGYASPDKQDPFLQEIRKVMNETKDIAQSVRDDADAGKFNGGGSVDQEALLQLAIKTTTSLSPFHHITDSANMRVLDFGMEGKTEQRTTSGKNLCSPFVYDYALALSDGSMQVSTTKKSTDFIPYDISSTYYISKGNNESIMVYGYDVDKEFVVRTGDRTDGILNKSSFAAMLQEGRTVDEVVYIRCTVPLVDGSYDERIQIEAGSVATDYEPYTNGPSPNPDYPQEIVNAGVYNKAAGRYEIGCYLYAKNLVDENGWNVGYFNPMDVGEKAYNNGSSIARCQTIPVPKNTLIHIRFDSVDGTSKLRARYQLLDENDIILECVHDSSSGINSYFDNINTDNACKLAISLFDLTPENVNVQVNLVELSDFDGYYTSKNITLTSPVPLTKWDYLTKRDGFWGWSIDHKIRENVLLANEKVSDNFYANKYCRFYVNSIVDGFVGAEGMCDGFRYTEGHTLDNTFRCGFWYGNTLVMIINPSVVGITDEDDGTTRLEKFLSYMADKPFNLVYQTAEEQSFHPLPEEEQELLRNLETYYGVTNVYNDQGCPMWLTYVADTKLYTDQQIAKQIAQTQALILEN